MHYGKYPKTAPCTGVASEARCTITRSSPRGLGAYSKPVATQCVNIGQGSHTALYGMGIAKRAFEPHAFTNHK